MNKNLKRTLIWVCVVGLLWSIAIGFIFGFAFDFDGASVIFGGASTTSVLIGVVIATHISGEKKNDGK